MTTIGISEARTHFGDVLRRVQQGERITITRRGVPIAHVEPIIQHNVADAASAMEALHRFRHEHRATLGDGVTIKDLIEEGRE